MNHPLADDLNAILDQTRDFWAETKGERFFLTGASGFFGGWLLDSLLWIQDRLALGGEVWLLSRDPNRFRRRRPWQAEHPAVRVVSGDVRDFLFPPGSFAYVVHAATSSAIAEPPAVQVSTILHGTNRVLAFARQANCRAILFTSSGAVYGPQPPELTNIPEDFLGGPDPTSLRSAYAEGKRMAELLAVLERETTGLAVKLARGFAFVGPYLPLDAHFAVGNFLRNAIQGEPIVIEGDGTPMRSYLYGSDLAAWLWTILLRGAVGRAYNVGSENAFSILQLAELVRDVVAPGLTIEVRKPAVPGQLPARYVPFTARAQSELSLKLTVPLADALRRTADWLRGPGRGEWSADRNN